MLESSIFLSTSKKLAKLINLIKCDFHHILQILLHCSLLDSDIILLDRYHYSIKKVIYLFKENYYINFVN